MHAGVHVTCQFSGLYCKSLTSKLYLIILSDIANKRVDMYILGPILCDKSGLVPGELMSELHFIPLFAQGKQGRLSSCVSHVNVWRFTCFFARRPACLPCPL